MMRKVDKRKE